MRPQPDIGHDAPRWPGARRVILAFRWDHPRALWAYSSWEAAIAPAAGRMLSTTAASGSGPFGDNAAELIFAGRASIERSSMPGPPESSRAVDNRGSSQRTTSSGGGPAGPATPSAANNA